MTQITSVKKEAFEAVKADVAAVKARAESALQSAIADFNNDATTIADYRAKYGQSGTIYLRSDIGDHLYAMDLGQLATDYHFSTLGGVGIYYIPKNGVWFFDGLSALSNDDALDLVMGLIGDGERIKFAEGKTYVFDRYHEFTLLSKSVVFDFSGAVFEFSNIDARLLLQAGWTAISSVSSISGSGEQLTLLNAAEVSTFREKDYIRIVSDDNPDGAFSAGFRNCEDVYLESASSGVLTMHQSALARMEAGNFNTNIRVAQRSGTTLHIIGGDMVNSQNVAEPATWESHSLLTVDGFTNPTIENVSCPRGLLPSIEVRACLNARVIGGSDGPKKDREYAADSPSIILGYGLRDSSLGTVITGRTARRTRHAIDTHEQAYGNQVDPSLYGTSVSLRAIQCTAFGCTSGTFATHHGCRDVKYINCTAFDGEEAGFSLRGDASMHGCSSIRCLEDVSAFEQGAGAKTSVRVYDHFSYASGPVQNKCVDAPLHLYNYTAMEALHDKTMLVLQTNDDNKTYFHGATMISPSKALKDETSPFFGNLAKGEVHFDQLDWYVDGQFFKQSDGASVFPTLFDCRNDTAGTRNFRMFGDVMRIHGAGLGVLFRSSPPHYPDANQIAFNVVVDDDAAIWDDASQNNLTNIQIARQGDEAVLGSINVLSVADARHPTKARSASVSVDFGASVAPSGIVTATIPVKGLNDIANYVVSGTCDNASVAFLAARVSSAETVSVTVMNTSTGTLDMSSLAINLSIISAAS